MRMVRVLFALLALGALAFIGLGVKALQYRQHNQRLNAELFALRFEPGKARVRADYSDRNAEAEALLSGRAVVLFGDSIAQRWGRPLPYTVNRGVGGETTAEMAKRFDRDVLALKPRGVVLVGGANDLQFAPATASCADVGDRAAQAIGDMARRAADAGLRVTVVGLPPPDVPGKALKGRCWGQVARINARLRDGAGYEFIDPRPALAAPAYSEDGLHPSPAGYVRLTEALAG